MLQIVKGNLFDNLNSNEEIILLHACNAQGVWGSGIAVEFKNRFPNSFLEYRRFCEEQKDEYDFGACGMTLLTRDNVACSVTSFDYGQRKDSPAIILRNTQMAVDDLLMQLVQKKLIKIYSPKINSGLFAVPWHQTQAVIEGSINRSALNVEWTVWEL